MKLVTKLSAISLGAFSIFAPIAVYRSYNVCYTKLSGLLSHERIHIWMYLEK